jgi:hypothetical protein
MFLLYEFIKNLKMADAMLSTRGKGSKKSSSSEGKGKSLKKNVCRDDKKVPSEGGPTERVIKDDKDMASDKECFFLLELATPVFGPESGNKKSGEPAAPELFSTSFITLVLVLFLQYARLFMLSVISQITNYFRLS